MIWIAMHRGRHRWIIIAGIAVAFVILAIFVFNRPTTSARLSVSFRGYTNLPNNNLRFALFSVQNHDRLPVRWRGNWIEIQGLTYHKAPTVNPNLPWFTATTLKPGDTLTLAVGEPQDEGGWRFCLLSSRYTVKQRFLDFALKHKLPTKLGPLVLVNPEQVLNPTNCTTSYSSWLQRPN